MRKIVYINQENKEISWLPTATRELRQLFWVYGLNAWITKYGGAYSIVYPNSKTQHTLFNLNSLSSLTAKEWLNTALHNAQPIDIGRDRYDKFDWWGNVDRYIRQETLDCSKKLHPNILNSL